MFAAVVAGFSFVSLSTEDDFTNCLPPDCFRLDDDDGVATAVDSLTTIQITTRPNLILFSFYLFFRWKCVRQRRACPCSTGWHTLLCSGN